MEKEKVLLTDGKAECNLYPGHSKCIKTIDKGDCPDKENHGCGSKQRKHATDSGLQMIQTAHFMRALKEGKHLEPLPGERGISDEAKVVIKNGPTFSPYP